MYIVGKLLSKKYYEYEVLYFLSLFWPRWVNGPKFGLNHGQSCIINNHVWLTYHTVYRNWAVLFWDYNFTITNLVLLIFFHFLLQKADINGDGYISADEYCRILREHGIDCTREEILQIMQIAGTYVSMFGVRFPGQLNNYLITSSNIISLFQTKIMMGK